MKIEIIPILEAKPNEDVNKPISLVSIPSLSSSTGIDLEKVFAEFLELEVGDGAASVDTIRSYISQTKQYLDYALPISL